MASAKTTTDHETIQQWVEERGGNPARVKSTGSKKQPGILRIDYPGFSGEDTLEAIDWETFFEAFEDSALAFLYQDEPNSRFSKFVARDRMREDSATAMQDGGTDGDTEDEPDDEADDEVDADELDAIELLECQHRDVEGLFAQLREATNKRARKRLFGELADNLAAHSKIEELVFYPAVCAKQTAEQLHEAVEEHLGVKRSIAELLELDVDDALFMTKLAELEQQVEHHVDEEEHELFVQVREDGEVDLVALAPRLDQQFTKLMKTNPRKQVPNELDEPAELPC